MNSLIEVLTTSMSVEGGNFSKVFSRVFGELEISDIFRGADKDPNQEPPPVHTVKSLISQLLEFDPNRRLSGGSDDEDDEEMVDRESQRYMHMFQSDTPVPDPGQDKEADLDVDCPLIKQHTFFEGIDWDLLDKRLLPAPPIPVKVKLAAMKTYGYEIVKQVSDQYTGDGDEMEIWGQNHVAISLDDYLRRDGKQIWLEDAPMQSMIKKYVPENDDPGGSALFEGWLYNCAENLEINAPAPPEV